MLRCRLTQQHLHQNQIEQLLSEASRCVKCGRCLSVCPVYKETGREQGVARGKLSLIESHKGEELKHASKRLKEIIYLCLLCGSCTENCPNLVEGDKIIQKARGAFISKNYPSLPLRLVMKHILPSPQKMDKLQKTGKLLQPLFLKKIPSESGLHLRFPFSSWGKNRIVPDIAKESFLKKYSPAVTPIKPDIALFIGCVSNYLFPHIAEAAAAIFNQVTTPLHIPQEQACCGLMAFGLGETEVARKLAQQNIKLFESIGSIPIVAFCSSCSSHLKQYSELFEEGRWKARAEAFSHRVKDFSEFFTEAPLQGSINDKPITSSRFLTFHDPCHLRRKQGIYDQPRYLLKKIKGVEFIETGKDNLCCGSGGSFNLSHYEISRRIFRRRLEPIEKAGVDTVVTSCMGCLLQFLDGFYQEGKGIRVKHLVEILGGTISDPGV